MYTNYNDYELIYLIKEGSQSALDMIFKKYEFLIYTKALYLINDLSKLSDLIQECRMVLYDCIMKYSFDFDVTFYSYFLICLRRKIKRELECEYYENYFILRENQTPDTLSSGITLDAYKRQFKNDKIAMIILEENILRDVNLHRIAIEYNLDYKHLIKKKREILEDFKKILTKNLN